MESLDRFDINADGIVTNDEIKRGHKRGVNRFMNLAGWLSNNGQWDSHTRHLLADDMEINYEQILKDFSEVSGAGQLEWKTQANGVRVPDVTEASMRLHFYGQTAPADVMRRLEIPGLFMWGDKDRQVGVARQVDAIEQANKKGAKVIYRRFPARHHLLSKREDYDWLEQDFMPVIAQEVSAFLSTHVRPLQTAAQRMPCGDQPSCKSLSMTATLP
jgi:pimeloyl-ACP methyl ester carboxylesterase